MDTGNRRKVLQQTITNQEQNKEERMTVLLDRTVKRKTEATIRIIKKKRN